MSRLLATLALCAFLCAGLARPVMGETTNQPLPAYPVYAVEAATFGTPPQAHALAARLREKGWLGARVIMLRDGNSRSWFIVLVDTATSRKEARVMAAALGRSGINAAVNQRNPELLRTRIVTPPELLIQETTPESPQSAGVAGSGWQARSASTAIVSQPDSTIVHRLGNSDDSTNARPAVRVHGKSAVGATGSTAGIPVEAPAGHPSSLATAGSSMDSGKDSNDRDAALAASQADPFVTTERDRLLMLARGTQRQGDLRGSIPYWQEAYTRWPQHEEVLDAYIDALIELENTSDAERLLRPWLARTPNNPLALRQAGRLELARGTPEAAVPYFERLVALEPNNADHMQDYANTLLEAGDKAGAMEAFSRAHDLRPAVDSAPADTLAELLAEYRPHLKQEYTWENQRGNNNTGTWAWALDTPVGDSLRMSLLYDLITVDSPAYDAEPSSFSEIQEKRVRLDYSPVSELTWRAGVGQAVGNNTQTETSEELGVIWNLHRGGRLSLMGQRGRPWYNTVDAARLGGNYDDVILDYTATLADVWRIELNGGLRRYMLDTTTYGTENEFIGSFGRQLFAAPEVVLSYQFQRSRFTYQDPGDDPHPVDMLERQDTHGLLLDMADWVTPSVGWFATAGVQQDVFKLSPSSFLGGGLRLRVGHRLELEAGYTYQSDTDTAYGGYAHVIKTMIQYTF